MEEGIALLDCELTLGPREPCVALAATHAKHVTWHQQTSAIGTAVVTAYSRPTTPLGTEDEEEEQGQQVAGCPAYQQCRAWRHVMTVVKVADVVLLHSTLVFVDVVDVRVRNHDDDW